MQPLTVIEDFDVPGYRESRPGCWSDTQPFMTPARRRDLGFHKAVARCLMLKRSFPAAGSSSQ